MVGVEVKNVFYAAVLYFHFGVVLHPFFVQVIFLFRPFLTGFVLMPEGEI